MQSVSVVHGVIDNPIGSIEMVVSSKSKVISNPNRMKVIMSSIKCGFSSSNVLFIVTLPPVFWVYRFQRLSIKSTQPRIPIITNTLPIASIPYLLWILWIQLVIGSFGT